MILLVSICIVIALAFGLAWFRLRGRVLCTAALAWLAYPPYEFWIQSRCTGDCNIRVDLLLVAPLLLWVSVAALIAIVRRWRSSR